jgi:chromosome segregation protein
LYLEKLNIHGFKSFAKKTRLDFMDGVTVIVGPNGCGKSNVVDAIRWVLGEQKAGSIRSDRMENVIFNGTKSMKPLGMSEVSMTIHNTKNVLPVEYSEVVITRRLFRSLESQYLLNNQPCRLRDMQKLFMGTGMASNA